MPAALKITNSGIPSFVPEPNFIAFGELTLNWADSLLFFKNKDGVIKSISPSAPTVLTRTAVEGLPGPAEAILLVSGALSDGVDPVAFAPLLNAGYDPYLTWTDTGDNSISVTQSAVWNDTTNRWEVHNNGFVWRSAVTSIIACPNPTLAVGWEPIAPAEGIPGLVFENPVPFTGQFCRVGDVSPYDWYQWDGDGWRISISSIDSPPDVAPVHRVVQCSAAYYASLSPNEDPQTLYIIVG
jgi:hypothetical protein